MTVLNHLRGLIFLNVILLSVDCFSQDTTFLDSNWEEVSSLKKWEYFVVLDHNSENHDIVTERMYNRSGQIKHENVYSNYTTKIEEGTCKKWYMNGRIKSEIDYKEGKYHGKILTYWDNGQVKRNDLWENGKVVSGIVKNADGTDLPYYDFETMPVYPGGTAELAKFIQKETKYPKKARRKGIYGKVIVRFIVSKNGDVDHAIIKQSINEDLDAEALRVVGSMPKWEPAKFDGEYVPVFFNLPINFSLK